MFLFKLFFSCLFLLEKVERKLPLFCSVEIVGKISIKSMYINKLVLTCCDLRCTIPNFAFAYCEMEIC